MKIDDHLLRFPRYLPNDLEGFLITYPNKFPPIVSYYEEVVKNVAYSPKSYQDYADWATKEVEFGFNKINTDFERGDREDLEFLVLTDQRLNKMFCYRFWVVNYLFADGPIHEFYTDNLKNIIRKFVDVTDDIEDFEGKIVQIQRDVMQTDYADYYLRQALTGVKVYDLLQQYTPVKSLMNRAIELIDSYNKNKVGEINTIWKEILSRIENESDDKSKALVSEIWEPYQQAKMRNNILPVYNMLTQAVEFREDNKSLLTRQQEMLSRIKKIENQAKSKLSEEEYQDFVISYEQARNCGMYKDIIGNIDHVLLPLWFGIHTKIKQILEAEGYGQLTVKPTGHAGMFNFLVWYLPDRLKAQVMTPDIIPYSLEEL